MSIIDPNEELILNKKDAQEWDMLQTVLADAYKRLACIVLRNKFGVNAKVMKTGKVKIEGELYTEEEFEDWLLRWEDEENPEFDENGDPIKYYDA